MNGKSARHNGGLLGIISKEAPTARYFFYLFPRPRPCALAARLLPAGASSPLAGGWRLRVLLLSGACVAVVSAAAAVGRFGPAAAAALLSLLSFLLFSLGVSCGFLLLRFFCWFCVLVLAFGRCLWLWAGLGGLRRLRRRFPLCLRWLWAVLRVCGSAFVRCLCASRARFCSCCVPLCFPLWRPAWGVLAPFASLSFGFRAGAGLPVCCCGWSLRWPLGCAAGGVGGCAPGLWWLGCVVAGGRGWLVGAFAVPLVSLLGCLGWGARCAPGCRCAGVALPGGRVTAPAWVGGLCWSPALLLVGRCPGSALARRFALGRLRRVAVAVVVVGSFSVSLGVRCGRFLWFSLFACLFCACGGRCCRRACAVACFGGCGLRLWRRCVCPFCRAGVRGLVGGLWPLGCGAGCLCAPVGGSGARCGCWRWAVRGLCVVGLSGWGCACFVLAFWAACVRVVVVAGFGGRAGVSGVCGLVRVWGCCSSVLAGRFVGCRVAGRCGCLVVGVGCPSAGFVLIGGKYVSEMDR